ncbi:hypothetical protein VAR608DRAFT_1762 [Variovorax sp. HW608]|nr:hypothetical protein VAR608DRAFT_1762 [Variovorax sp. HW608]
MSVPASCPGQIATNCIRRRPAPDAARWIRRPRWGLLFSKPRSSNEIQQAQCRGNRRDSFHGRVVRHRRPCARRRRRRRRRWWRRWRKRPRRRRARQLGCRRRPWRCARNGGNGRPPRLACGKPHGSRPQPWTPRSSRTPWRRHRRPCKPCDPCNRCDSCNSCNSGDARSPECPRRSGNAGGACNPCRSTREQVARLPPVRHLNSPHRGPARCPSEAGTSATWEWHETTG